MGSYSLTKAADEDFESIFDFGIETFGLDQALKYQNSLTKRFSDIPGSPLLYPGVEEIREDYRRSAYKSHSIYYRVEGNEVLIVRILGQQDPAKAF